MIRCKKLWLLARYYKSRTKVRESTETPNGEWNSFCKKREVEINWIFKPYSQTLSFTKILKTIYDNSKRNQLSLYNSIKIFYENIITTRNVLFLFITFIETQILVLMSFQSQSTYHIRIIIFAQLHLIYPIQITYHNIVSKQKTIFKKDTMDTIITLQFSFNSIVERCIAIVVTIACNNVYFVWELNA